MTDKQKLWQNICTHDPKLAEWLKQMKLDWPNYGLKLVKFSTGEMVKL